MTAPAYRGDPLTRPRIAHRPMTGPIADRCRVPGHDHARRPDPVPGWRDLGAYLAGRAPAPELEPRPFVHCPDCHGWHGVGVTHR